MLRKLLDKAPYDPSMLSRRRGSLPRWLRWAALLLVVTSWIPLVVIAKARVSTSSEPRVHIFQDMDNQPKYREQAPSDLFADGRAMRPKIVGTVARGELLEDDHYYRGYQRKWDEQANKWQVTYFPGLPEKVAVDDGLLRRGQERYGIYCATCHGDDGAGSGPVVLRSEQLGSRLNARNLHDQAVRELADGHIFNVITNGIRTMPPHGGQINVHDRWAIVAYVRALQLSQHAPASAVPPEKLDTMRE